MTVDRTFAESKEELVELIKQGKLDLMAGVGVPTLNELKRILGLEELDVRSVKVRYRDERDSALAFLKRLMSKKLLVSDKTAKELFLKLKKQVEETDNLSQ